MGAIDQKEFMIAMQGEDTSLWSVPCGFFPPVSPLASDAGMSVLTGKRDYAAVKKALEAAGYQGEKVVLMGATDQPANYPLAEIAADMLKRVGVNVDYQATDWGMVVQRRALTKPPAEGGWNLFCTGFSGLDFFTPASHLPLRGNGKGAWFGWPDDPKIEALREAWFNAPDLAGAEEDRRGDPASRRSRTCRTTRSGWRSLRPRSARTSPACRRALRSSGTSAAPDGGPRPATARSSSSSARRCAPAGARARRWLRVSMPPSSSVARSAEPLFVPTGGVGPVRAVRGLGDGGAARGARRAAGAHPAGGDRHRHAVLGARGRGPAAPQGSPRRCSCRAACITCRAASCCCACWECRRGRRYRRWCRPRRAGGGAATGGCARSRRCRTTRWRHCSSAGRESDPAYASECWLPSRGRGVNQTGPAPGTWLGCRTAPRWGRAAHSPRRASPPGARTRRASRSCPPAWKDRVGRTGVATGTVAFHLIGRTHSHDQPV